MQIIFRNRSRHEKMRNKFRAHCRKKRVVMRTKHFYDCASSKPINCLNAYTIIIAISMCIHQQTSWASPAGTNKIILIVESAKKEDFKLLLNDCISKSFFKCHCHFDDYPQQFKVIFKNHH